MARVAAKPPSSAGTHDVAEVAERDVVRPAVRSVVVADPERRRDGDTLGLGEHLGQQARVQRVVHQLPRDLAPRVTGPQPGEGADGGAELGEHAEVAEAGRVDR